MQIVKRIKQGKLKGWTIRQSKFGWYDVYSSRGVSQGLKQMTLEEVNEFIKLKSE